MKSLEYNKKSFKINKNIKQFKMSKIKIKRTVNCISSKIFLIQKQLIKFNNSNSNINKLIMKIH